MRKLFIEMVWTNLCLLPLSLCVSIIVLTGQTVAGQYAFSDFSLGSKAPSLYEAIAADSSKRLDEAFANWRLTKELREKRNATFEVLCAWSGCAKILSSGGDLSIENKRHILLFFNDLIDRNLSDTDVNIDFVFFYKNAYLKMVENSSSNKFLLILNSKPKTQIDYNFFLTEIIAYVEEALRCCGSVGIKYLVDDFLGAMSSPDFSEYMEQSLRTWSASESDNTKLTDFLTSIINGPNIVLGTDYDDYLQAPRKGGFVFGYDGADIILGGGGNDFLCGGPGNDIFIAGRGNNYVYGDGGENTYVFSAGDGPLTIDQWIFDEPLNNTLVFRGDLSLDDLVCTLDNSDLILTFNGKKDRVIIAFWVPMLNMEVSDSDQLFYPVSNIIFPDGRKLIRRQISERVIPFANR